MAKLTETGDIEAPFPDDDPVERLMEFYLANGYRLVERSKRPVDSTDSTEQGAHHSAEASADTDEADEADGVEPEADEADEADGVEPEADEAAEASSPADPQTVTTAAQFARGESGAGWWTSNMTELGAELHIERDGDTIHLSYRVDISGQVLNEKEEGFWRRELDHARRYCKGEDDEPRDLRPAEAKRADNVKNSFRSTGIWAGVAVFFAIVALALLGII